MRRTPQTETYPFQKFDRNIDRNRSHVFIKHLDYFKATAWDTPQHEQTVPNLGHWEIDWRDNIYSCFSTIKEHPLQRCKRSVHLLW